MSGEGRRGRQEAARFRRRLADLKRNGSNVLLVGAGGVDTACERLLGESSVGLRYRLFVTTDAGPATARARLASSESDRSSASGRRDHEALVLDWDAAVRGSRADGSAVDTDRPAGIEHPAGEAPSPSVRRVGVGSDDLRELGAAIEDAIEQFDAENGGLSPAELRLCFGSMRPLLADHDGEDARRFLRDLTGTVERFDGMAHYHLPVEYGSETVDAVESLFDAVVEVRYEGGDATQRWHLADPDVTTDWLPL